MDKKNFFILAVLIFTFSFGRFIYCQEVVIDTTNNQLPKIILTALNAGGNDVSLRDIQKSAGYKVEILGDSPEKLDIKFSGPISIKQKSTTEYEVTLSLLASETAFDNWSESKEKPYRVSFTVAIKNVDTKQTVNEMGVFTFGKW